MSVGDRPITTTFMDRLFRSETGRALGLPIMPLAFKGLRPDNYDLVVTSTHAFSRSFPTRGATHLSYTYTPIRYVWYPETDQRGSGVLLSPARAALKRLDLYFASSVTSFAGISSVVSERIEDTYGREAETIFPPCDTDFFSDDADGDVSEQVQRIDPGYIVSVGRLIPYKRHDLAIRVAARLGLRAVVAGVGPELDRLRKVDDECGNITTFVIGPNRDTIRYLYRNAVFTSFPALEDFGIVPVESLATGTPVLALDEGGAVDTVSELAGVRAASQNVQDMVSAAERLLNQLPQLEACRRQAQNFSNEMFDRRIESWAEQCLNA